MVKSSARFYYFRQSMRRVPGTSKKWFCLLSFIYAAGGIKFVVHLSRPRPRQNLHHCV